MNDRVSIVYYEDDQTTKRIETSDVARLMKETRETTLRNLAPNEATKYQMHTCRYSQCECSYDNPCRDFSEYQCKAVPDCAGSDIMCIGDETTCPTATLVGPASATPCRPPDHSSHACTETCAELSRTMRSAAVDASTAMNASRMFPTNTRTTIIGGTPGAGLRHRRAGQLLHADLQTLRHRGRRSQRPETRTGRRERAHRHNHLSRGTGQKIQGALAHSMKER